MTTKNQQKSDREQFTSQRRSFLRKAGSAAALATFGSAGVSTAHRTGSGPFSDDPFSLGIASGDPLPTAVVLWTRLAPQPLEGDGGMPDHQFPVQWRVATDENMRHIVKKGTVHARPKYAHSVHVDVQELEPNTEYYYQFKAGPKHSPVGRTKTAPAPDASVDEFSFAFASCQQRATAYYTAHQHLANEDIDLVVYLGDYIYEGNDQGSLGRGHEPPYACQSLSDYRIRHAQYKTDPNLQAAHAAFPWIVTWDDHEVANNYADEISQNDDPPEEFLERRANAYQAYWENQPLRRSRMPDGPDMPLYRRFSFGNMVEFNVLDTRQYRDDQTYSVEKAKDVERTLLGDEQERWLLDGLNHATSRWNVLAQQIPFAATDENPDPDVENFGTRDKWDGYRADRNTLLETMTQQSDLNPVVITGDVHRNYVFDIKSDFNDPDSETVGTEYVGTSLSSFGDGSGVTQYGGSVNGPWQEFYNDNRGYVRCTLTSDQWQADYRVVSTVEQPDASASTIASFVTEANNPGAQLISDPNPYPDTDYSEYDLIPQSQMSAKATSYHEGKEPFRAIDGYYSTNWHAEWDAELPESITLDLGDSYNVETLIYLPRRGGVNGTVTEYNIFISSDGDTFNKVANGNWPLNPESKTATLSPQQARYVRLQVVEGNNGFASAAEINIAQASDD
jgi:alkaline phosphatase D